MTRGRKPAGPGARKATERAQASANARLLERARKRMRSGDFEGAADLLDDVPAERIPPELLADLGECYMRLERPDDALLAFGDAAERAPTEPRYPLQHALVLWELGDEEGAERELRSVQERFPEYPQAPFHLGRMHADRGDLEIACEAFGEALDRDPHHGRAHQALAEAYYALEEFDGAVHHLERAIESDPDELAEVEIQLGNALVRAERYDSAEAHYLRAVEADPDATYDAYSAWGKLLTDADRLDEALEKLGVARAARPDHPYAHAYAGVALSKQGRPLEAVRCFQRALAVVQREEDDYVGWITAEYVDALRRADRAADARRVLVDTLQSGYASDALLLALREIDALIPGPTAHRMRVTVHGETGEGRGFYLEAEVVADEGEQALGLVRPLCPKVQGELELASVDDVGPPGPLVGVYAIGEPMYYTMRED